MDMRLSDTIEQFIKLMLGQEEQEVELKRNELAEYFGCAPSQINYVLSTRFTPDHGYTTESRRGGGGCIRVIRIHRGDGEFFRYLMQERIGDTIDTKSAQMLLHQLAEQGSVSTQEAQIMYAALTPQALSVPIPEPLKDAIRAKILRNMLLKVVQKDLVFQEG